MFARRRGANWFIGAITAGGARTVAAPLSFLGAGTWSAEIYADAANKSIALSSRKVTGADTLQVPVLTNGGFVVALTPG